jgi:hypothetical protein
MFQATGSAVGRYLRMELLGLLGFVLVVGFGIGYAVRDLKSRRRRLRAREARDRSVR